ncbi:MAG: methylated-DNA--[protein]-cysteine S-methyltransferase [Deltaproteobacteria bacterium]|jgi:methylated-DNA-[protein]-cysteine S-methyltransferase|nr:methylated-DNA--[protein]-cysteine S-methyltransferase [Deltaproteobacteria bacterium]
MNYSTTYESPVGVLTVASDGESLTGLWIEGQKYHGAAQGAGFTERGGIPAFRKAKLWLDRYFEGRAADAAELPLKPAGGAFRQAVWAALREIPYGEVTTYGRVAGKMSGKSPGMTTSARAVGGAVGRNPISIIVPCHRVVGANGSLTGYAGGIRAKIRLLELEGVDMSGLFIPEKGTAL